MLYQAVKDGIYQRSNAPLSVCRIDCCTFFVEMDGFLAIFDPWLQRSANHISFWSSYHAEPVFIEKLPKPDLLLISQDGNDHRDLSSISELPRDTVIVGPKDVVKRINRLGFDGHAISPGETHEIGPFQISALPSRHPWILKQNTYLLSRNDKSVLFVSDPAMTDDLVEAVDKIGRKPNVLLISSTELTLRFFGRIIMSPEEAADIAVKVGAPYIFPMRTLMEEKVEGFVGEFLVRKNLSPDEAFERFKSSVVKKAPDLNIERLQRGEAWEMKY
jgi:L-ascorbate metabolism protein UlaG (beta-lactamase superfamily)